MGTYNLSAAEIIDQLRDWMLGLEGELHADELAKAFNKLADKNGWLDKLISIDTSFDDCNDAIEILTDCHREIKAIVIKRLKQLEKEQED